MVYLESVFISRFKKGFVMLETTDFDAWENINKNPEKRTRHKRFYWILFHEEKSGGKTIGKQCNNVIRSQCEDCFFYHVFS